MRFTSTINPDARQRGFSVPAAIFIIVILAALGAFMVTIGSGQQLGHAQDIAGSRALQAARTGIEWGIYQVVTASTSTFRTNCNNNTGTPSTLPTLTNMTDMTVVVSCTSVAYTEGSTAFRTYRLTATACNTTSCPTTTAPWPALYVERRIVTNVTK